MEKRKIELLAPAGDMERLKMAVAYGADAVYLAGTTFGMRAFAGNFDQDELYQAVALLPKPTGWTVHVTINTMPRNRRGGPRCRRGWRCWRTPGWTPSSWPTVGAFRLAQKYAPHVQRHISTQASICNYETARAWYDLGASRVILARELSLGGDPGDPGKDPAGAGDRGLCPRRHVRELFRSVPAVQLHDRSGFQPGRLRPALPVSVRPDGGEAPRGVFPSL